MTGGATVPGRLGEPAQLRASMEPPDDGRSDGEDALCAQCQSAPQWSRPMTGGATLLTGQPCEVRDPASMEPPDDGRSD